MMTERNILMMMGVVFPKQNVRQIYNEKYQKTYYNRNYFLDRDYIKDTRIIRVHSGRKWKAAGFVYLKGSPYHGAEGSSQLRPCLHDAIINSSPRIGGNFDNLEFYRQFPPRRVKETQTTNIYRL